MISFINIKTRTYCDMKFDKNQTLHSEEIQIL